MHKPLFTLPVRDLERSDQRRRWDLPPDWLDWALSESDARSDGSAGALEVYVKKTGREILVKGEASARVTMPCARTLEPTPVVLEAEIYLLLSPRQQPGGAAKAGRRARERREASVEEQLSSDMAARDEYDGETVELDAFVREHLLLELPLFPVKSDLPFDPAPATDTPPDESGATTGGAPDPHGGTPEPSSVDPRLAPLAALAGQLQRSGKLDKSDKE